jgi:transposase-like protein
MSKQARSSGVTAGKVYNQYSDDFRRDAVAMIESEGLTAAEVGRRLGVNVNLLRKWRAKYGKKSPIQEVQSELETENRRLRGHSDANFSILRRTALSLLKNECTAKVGIKNKRLMAGWDPDYLTKVLFKQ